MMRFRKMVWRGALFVLAGIFASLQFPAVAQQNVAKPVLLDTARGEAMLDAYFRAETAKLRDRCLADIETLDDWKAKREEYRRQLFEMLSLDPLPEKTDLKPTIVGTLDHAEFTVEKLHFQPMPQLYVAANLYLPKGLKKPAPTILYVCGHANVVKDGKRCGNKAAYQHHGAWFARHGYVCLIVDTIQRGEFEGRHWGTYGYNMWWWNARGYTPAGVEAWTAIRALDYLETRPEVDPARFGVTGRSGGGAYSWWVTALDDRIQAAVPVAGITDLWNYVVDGAVEGHCDCMFMVNTYRWDYPLVAALAAPRPLLISNSDKDTIFPLDGVVRLHEKVRRIYRLYGAEDKLGLQITEGPHQDTQELRVHAFSWFNRFLKGERPLIDKPAEKFFDVEELKVFGDKLPADERVTTIHETFTQKAPPAEPPASKEEWEKQRDGWMTALREKVFRGWPTAEEAGPLNIELAFTAVNDGMRLTAYDFDSQPHVRLRLYLLSKDGAETTTTSLTVASEETWPHHLAYLRAAFSDQLKDEVNIAAKSETYSRDVKLRLSDKQMEAWIAPRGVGPAAWCQPVADRGETLTKREKNERRHTQVRRRFNLLGQTLDGMRVWDVRRAIQTLSQLKSEHHPTPSPRKIQLISHNSMAGVALYASLFEPAVAHVSMGRPPHSHRQGPVFLNVLRYMDLYQAITLVAAEGRVSVFATDRHGAWKDWRNLQTLAKSTEWRKTRLEIVGP